MTWTNGSQCLESHAINREIRLLDNNEWYCFLFISVTSRYRERYMPIKLKGMGKISIESWSYFKNYLQNLRNQKVLIPLLLQSLSKEYQMWIKSSFSFKFYFFEDQGIHKWHHQKKFIPTSRCYNILFGIQIYFSKIT